MREEQETRRLSDIKVDNPYLRMGTDVSRIEKSIETVGLIAPLVVTPDNRLLAGGRRYQALLNLGFEDAPVKIVRADELESELISIDENLVRKDLNRIELEAHFKRAKELYEALHEDTEEYVVPTGENPSQQIHSPSSEEKQQTTEDSSEEMATNSEESDRNASKEVQTEHVGPEENKQSEIPKQRLASEAFYESISEKTGMSHKQIQQAITREEKASPEVKEARAKGELSLSQTNELIKLEKEDQSKALDQLKTRPVREIRHIIKLAKAKGIDQALSESPEGPHAREFRDLESQLKKLNRLFKRFEMEKIDMNLLPGSTKKHLVELQENLQEMIPRHNYRDDFDQESDIEETSQLQ